MFVFFGPSLNLASLLLMAFDTVFVMFLVQIVCQFWQCSLLRWLNNAVEPVVYYITGCFAKLLYEIAGITLRSQLALLILTAFCLFILRQIVAGIIMNG